MLTLHQFQDSGNCYKVRLALHQLELPFRTVEVDLLGGETRQPEFKSKTVIGKTPLVELEDGRFLSESGAILCHFARGTPLMSEDPFEQTQTLRWMFFEQNNHEPNVATARSLCVYSKAQESEADWLAKLRERGHAALAVMEQHLEREAFFAGGRYSIADIALFAYTQTAPAGGIELDPYPAIAAWMSRVKEQPRHVPREHVF